MFLRLALMVTFSAVTFGYNQPPSRPQVVCIYDTNGDFRKGQAKFNVSCLHEAVSSCTILLYGYAGICPITKRAISLSQYLDIHQHNYRNVTDLKRRYPWLRVLLSFGGDRDDPHHSEKYLKLLESESFRMNFIESAKALAYNFGFDGIDLAWQFPKNKPKKIHDTLGGIGSKIKHVFVNHSEIDPKHKQHRDNFTLLVCKLKKLSPNLMVSLTVLPDVNSTLFHDVKNLANCVDLVNICPFDYFTPERNPKEADYTAPLYHLPNRNREEYGHYQVQYWLNKGLPSGKLIYGIATYGRTWKLTKSSDTIPPFKHVDGVGTWGPHTMEPGLLSYEEICVYLQNRHNCDRPLRKVDDPNGNHGIYAVKLPDKHGHGGLWVSYEDPTSVRNKISYIHSQRLGGMAIMDLTLDDFRGQCSNVKYPILKTALLL